MVHFWWTGLSNKINCSDPVGRYLKKPFQPRVAIGLPFSNKYIKEALLVCCFNSKGAVPLRNIVAEYFDDFPEVVLPFLAEI